MAFTQEEIDNGILEFAKAEFPEFSNQQTQPNPFAEYEKERAAIFSAPEPEPKPDPLESRGMLGEIGTSIARGVFDVGEMGLRAMRLGQDKPGEDVGFIDKLATRGLNAMEEYRAESPTLQAKYTDGVKGAISGGVTAASTSLAAGLPGMVAGAAAASFIPVVGTAMGAILGYALSAGGLFGVAQYDDVIQRADAQGISRDESESAAIWSGVHEAGWEFVSDLVGAKVLKITGKALTPVAKETLKQGIGSLFKTGFKQTLKQMAKLSAVETGTEMLTAGFQADIETGIGMGDKTFWEGAKAAFGPSFVASVIFGGIGAGGAKFRRGNIENSLVNPESDIRERLSAATQVKDTLKDIDPDIADVWFDNAIDTISAKEAIETDTDVTQTEPVDSISDTKRKIDNLLKFKKPTPEQAKRLKKHKKTLRELEKANIGQGNNPDSVPNYPNIEASRDQMRDNTGDIEAKRTQSAGAEFERRKNPEDITKQVDEAEILVNTYKESNDYKARAEAQRQIESLFSPGTSFNEGLAELEANIAEFRRLKSRDTSVQALEERQQAMRANTRDNYNFQRGIADGTIETEMPLAPHLLGMESIDNTPNLPFADLGRKLRSNEFQDLGEINRDNYDDGINIGDAEFEPETVHDQRIFQQNIAGDHGVQDQVLSPTPAIQKEDISQKELLPQIDAMREMESKGYEVVGPQKVAVATLNEGDKFIGTVDGKKDEYTVKGTNEDGETLLQDGVAKPVDNFGEVTIDGIKRADGTAKEKPTKAPIKTNLGIPPQKVVKKTGKKEESQTAKTIQEAIDEAKSEIRIIKKYPKLSDNPAKEIAAFEKVIAENEAKKAGTKLSTSQDLTSPKKHLADGGALFSEENRLSNIDKNGSVREAIQNENPGIDFGKPIIIYRATMGDSIRPNDYVAITKEIAEQHLKNLKDRGESGKIISVEVSAKDLLIANDATEFVYSPTQPSTPEGVQHSIGQTPGSGITFKKPTPEVKGGKKTKPKKTETGTALYHKAQSPNKTITLSDAKQSFQGQKVTEDQDGSISIRMKNGKGARITSIEHIDEDNVTFGMESGDMNYKGDILGKIVGTDITLKINGGGTFTLTHEIKHLLDNLQIITPTDNQALMVELRKGIKAGDLGFELSPLKDEKLARNEDLANMFAKIIEERKKWAGTKIGKLIQRVLDFVDGLHNIGKQSARKLAREFESGEIYSRKVNGKTVKTTSPAFETSAPQWYSVLEKGIESFKQNKAPGAQWLGMVKKMPGLKQEELEWVGLEGWLKEQKRPVLKQDILDFVRAHGVRVEEVVKAPVYEAQGTEGDTVYFDSMKEAEEFIEGEWDWVENESVSVETDENEESIYAMDHNGNALVEFYKEENEDGKTVWTNADEEGYQYTYDEAVANIEDAVEKEKNYWKENIYDPKLSEDGGVGFAEYQLPGGKNYKEILLTLPGIKEKFKSPHFDEPNIIAHVRMSERTVDGKKVLHIEEIQSDFLQDYRKSVNMISKAVENNFPEIVKSMETGNVLKEIC